MHEWGLTRALLGELARVAAAQGGGKILAAKVKISALAGISPMQLRRQFEIAAMGSAAEGATLQVEVAPEGFEGRADGVFVESIEIAE